ncbi:hypothetical protein CQJ94_15330 [Glycomyces fuscus]|nr:hypothetical protein CQJ94_15330 [Glycomyces fuscus]
MFRPAPAIGPDSAEQEPSAVDRQPGMWMWSEVLCWGAASGGLSGCGVLLWVLASGAFGRGGEVESAATARGSRHRIGGPGQWVVPFEVMAPQRFLALA